MPINHFVQLVPYCVLHHVIMELVLVPTNELPTIVSSQDVEFSGALRMLSCGDNRFGVSV